MRFIPNGRTRTRHARWLLALAAFAAAVSVTTVMLAGGGQAAPPGVPAAAVPHLKQLATEMAANNGDPAAARTAVAVATTRQAAVGLESGAADRVDSNQAVYLVQLRGRFVGAMAKVPSGAPLPTGAVLHFTVDVGSGAVQDWGISDVPTNPSALGTVTSLG
jgi:hypothetical protein